ncbi:uncharacterized protein SETTUDRAFT_98206 [Exserohilum turcica Et28A]|uniref:Histidine acid phosphatase n=1 Tax=Exserohilum turcicum (strain 28A) TaxID=671987 RepID=R0JLR9_EXST2|nr:uncharacterized protein SETTUDRAFT_98206 [Exserohilum turcica Et28A]EOA82168.1 hypothetical protein SETTUDRAFT_98206 [Exserohilum turcica Et28A]
MFVRTSIAALASAWVAAAQTSSQNTTYRTHAAFAFVRTGERTPFLSNGPQTLTALGAKQMYTLGENFRTRYIAGDSPQRLGVQRIAGLSVDTINNDQIWVQTLDEPYLIASAQAFMQGLYPPRNSSTGQLADGTSVDYAFSGYQYTNIRSASQSDPDSRSISGSLNCPVAQTAALNYFSSQDFRAMESANADLFDKLDVNWFNGTLPQSFLDARSAIEIDDYLSYQYAHNSTMFELLSANNTNLTGVYAQLGYLADQIAWNVYGNTSSSARASNNQAISGKTLAGSLLNSFRTRIASQLSLSDGALVTPSPPLSLYFGEEDAMISLAALLRLDTQSPYFRTIPSYSSAMIFELFSVSNSTTTDATQIPTDPSALWVRFSFHNATAAQNNPQLTAYPVFGNGPSNTEIPWTEFEPLVAAIAVSGVAHWCDMCSSETIFCTGVQDSRPDFPDAPYGGRRPKKGDDDDDDDDDRRGFNAKANALAPAVAGVIGAVVTLVVAALVFALLMLCAGLRFHRVHKQTPNLNFLKRNKPTTATLGGFKGSAKMASDPDLALAQNGAAMPDPVKKAGHERVGSWELKQKELGKDVGERNRESLDADDVVPRAVEPRNGV